VLYVKHRTIIEDMFICKPIENNNSKEFFKIVDNFMKRKSIKRPDCV
jgi:hypothetical protein